MKDKYVGLLVIVIGVCSACSVEQELFIKPKAKKVYVSAQQDAELDGDLVVLGTDMAGVLWDLGKTVFLITQNAISRVNNYACGEKNGLGKVERTELYAKKMKIKESLDRFIEQVQEMQQALEDLSIAVKA